MLRPTDQSLGTHVAPFDLTWRRHALDDRVRAATATLRGAALALAAVAVTVREEVATGSGCPDTDRACLTDAHARLLRHRHRVELAASEVERLERAQITYDVRVPLGAPRQGWHVPTVTAARNLVDQANDAVLVTLGEIRAALARLDAPLGADA